MIYWFNALFTMNKGKKLMFLRKTLYLMNLKSLIYPYDSETSFIYNVNPSIKILYKSYFSLHKFFSYKHYFSYIHYMYKRMIRWRICQWWQNAKRAKIWEPIFYYYSKSCTRLFFGSGCKQVPNFLFLWLFRVSLSI